MLDVARHPRPLMGAIAAIALICGASLTVACASYGLHFGGLMRVLFPSLYYPHGCISHLTMAKVRVRATHEATVQFAIEHNACPWGVDQLLAERYLDKDKVRDPWGNGLVAECFYVGDEPRIRVRSVGPDGQVGTADDVRSDD